MFRICNYSKTINQRKRITNFFKQGDVKLIKYFGPLRKAKPVWKLNLRTTGHPEQSDREIESLCNLMNNLLA